MTWPVSSDYGPRTVNGQQNFHTGRDYACSAGTPLAATIDGRARVVRSDTGYGWHVLIDRKADAENSMLTVLYGHLSRFHVVGGQHVYRGTLVADSGGADGHPGAGWSTGAHLHYEERVDGAHRAPRLDNRIWEVSMFTEREETFLKNLVMRAKEEDVDPIDIARQKGRLEHYKEFHKAAHSTEGSGAHTHAPTD